MATAEVSKFAGILSEALSQHHFLGFEFSSTGIPTPPQALFVVQFVDLRSLVTLRDHDCVSSSKTSDTKNDTALASEHFHLTKEIKPLREQCASRCHVTLATPWTVAY